MVRSSIFVVLPLMLATLLATANAQNYAAPTPESPLPGSPSSPPPPPPRESSSISIAPPSALHWPTPPSPPPPTSSPPPPSPPPPTSSPPPSPPSPPASDWTPVANVNDPAIQQVARFAVRIYALSKREPNMQLLNVVSCETQPSNGGYNYRLVITVSGGKKTQYEAFVWGIYGSRRTPWKLLGFTPKY